MTRSGYQSISAHLGHTEPLHALLTDARAVNPMECSVAFFWNPRRRFFQIFC